MSTDLNRRVREGLPVLEVVARRLAKRLGGRIEVDDLISLGHPALIEVARTYDPNRAKFATYAALKVKWAILDGLRRETNGGRAAIGRASGLAASARFGEGLAQIHADRCEGDPDPPTEEAFRARLQDLLAGHAAALALGLVTSQEELEATDDAVESPEDSASRAELRRTLHTAVVELPERERALIERHYFAGEPFDAIAKDIGISKSWASRLHAQAIRSLAEAMRRSDP